MINTLAPEQSEEGTPTAREPFIKITLPPDENFPEVTIELTLPNEETPTPDKVSQTTSNLECNIPPIKSDSGLPPENPSPANTRPPPTENISEAPIGITLPTEETQAPEDDEGPSTAKNPPATGDRGMPPENPPTKDEDNPPELGTPPEDHTRPSSTIISLSLGENISPLLPKQEVTRKKKMTDYFIRKCRPFEEKVSEGEEKKGGRKIKEKFPEKIEKRDKEKEKKERKKSVKLQSTKITPIKKNTLRNLWTSIEKKNITRKTENVSKKMGGGDQQIKICEEKRVSALKNYFEEHIEEGKNRDREKKLKDNRAEEKPLNLGEMKSLLKHNTKPTSLKSSRGKMSSVLQSKQTMPNQMGQGEIF